MLITLNISTDFYLMSVPLPVWLDILTWWPAAVLTVIPDDMEIAISD